MDSLDNSYTDSSSSEDERQESLMPGSYLAPNKRIQAMSLMLIYSGLHIHHKDFRMWLQSGVMDHSKSGELLLLGIYRRTSPVEYGAHKWTYVIIQSSTPISTRSHKIFRWEGNQPVIRTLKKQEHIERALNYVQNWQYIPSYRKKKAKRPLVVSESKQTRTEVCTSNSLVRAMVTKMQEQQGTSSRGTVCVMESSGVDHFDMDKFEECLTEVDLDYIDKSRYEFTCHVPRACSIGTFMEAAKTRGWLSEVLIFDLTRRAQLRPWEEAALSKLAIEYPATRVWLLTKYVPRVETWKVYKIDMECTVSLLHA